MLCYDVMYFILVVKILVTPIIHAWVVISPNVSSVGRKNEPKQSWSFIQYLVFVIIEWRDRGFIIRNSLTNSSWLCGHTCIHFGSTTTCHGPQDGIVVGHACIHFRHYQLDVMDLTQLKRPHLQPNHAWKPRWGSIGHKELIEPWIGRV